MFSFVLYALSQIGSSSLLAAYVNCCDAGLLYLNQAWGSIHIINRVACILRRWDSKIQELRFKHLGIYQVLNHQFLVSLHRLLHLQET